MDNNASAESKEAIMDSDSLDKDGSEDALVADTPSEVTEDYDTDFEELA